LIEAPTDKAAGKERDRRMREINSQNETAQTNGTQAAVTLKAFSSGFWDRYLRNKGAKPSTIYGYQSLLEKHILPVLGDKRLVDITPTAITEFLTGIARARDNGRRGPKLLNVYTLLRHMFEVATEYDLIPSNPVRKKLHRPKYRAKEKPVLTPHQIGLILAKVPAEWYALALAITLTTVRIGELVAIQWQDIDWMNARLTLSRNVWRGQLQDSTKTGAVVVRYLPKALMDALQVHRRNSKFVRPEHFVFARPDGAPVDPDWLRRNVLYPAMDKAGIDHGLRTHGFHIFRHAGDSIVRAQTGDIKPVQVQLSHAQLSTTSNVYVLTNEDDLKRAAEALAGTVQKFLPTNLPTN
jgi:integrase